MKASSWRANSPRAGRVRSACLELLRFLGLGYSCPRKMLINSDVEVLPTPGGEALRNVNTPAERAAAEQALG
jgi:molybdenum cofactor guanylyltransferase